MDYRRLGRTGLQVSPLCLGTMNFGLRCDEQTSRKILDRAYDGGITFLDTADVYPLGGSVETVGQTEEILGRWLPGRRDDVVLATKCVGVMGPRPWNRGASRRHIVMAVEASLRRLDTDYIDLYQLHSPDPLTPIDETLAALDHLVTSGKVLHVGCSNFLAYQVALAVGRSAAAGLVRFESVQPRHSLLFREFERELFPLCEQEEIAVIPYNPLAGGLLSGRHDRNEPPEAGSRFTLGAAGTMYQGRYWHEPMFDTVAALAGIAAELGMALPTLAVAWSLAQPAVTAPIIGASSPEQLEATLAAVDATLPADVLTRLDELTRQYRLGDAVR
jgi:aryl-alcohol dehydrogenase-like predicted oxidoreductase